MPLSQTRSYSHT
ncbi:hypothetical protein F383_35815 [Gossypium arboreum]|nr:hypothetical protein F383_35815 [Gossypium arboreum]